MNVKYKMAEEKHLQKIEDLHLIILELSKKQSSNQEKILLADEFKTHYRESKMKLNSDIVSLQKELLEALARHNLLQ